MSAFHQGFISQSELHPALQNANGLALWIDIWNDPEALLFEALDKGEERFLLIGKLRGKHWSAIFTYRGNKIRLISVRRSRKNEVAVYEKQ